MHLEGKQEPPWDKEGNGCIPRNQYLAGILQLILSTARVGNAPAPFPLKQTTGLLKKMESAFKIMSYSEKYYVSLLFTINT